MGFYNRCLGDSSKLKKSHLTLSASIQNWHIKRPLTGICHTTWTSGRVMYPSWVQFSRKKIPVYWWVLVIYTPWAFSVMWSVDWPPSPPLINTRYWYCAFGEKIPIKSFLFLWLYLFLAFQLGNTSRFF